MSWTLLSEMAIEMGELRQFVVFHLDGQRYALPLAAVERIVRAVEVTVLPNAPAMVLGVMNMAGRVLPVLSLRQCFGLPERDITPEDQFLIARTVRRTVALVADEALGVIERADDDIAGSTGLAPGVEQVQGVVKLDDGLVLILDPERCLFPAEARVLDAAIARHVPHVA